MANNLINCYSTPTTGRVTNVLREDTEDSFSLQGVIFMRYLHINCATIYITLSHISVDVVDSHTNARFKGISLAQLTVGISIILYNPAQGRTVD